MVENMEEGQHSSKVGSSAPTREICLGLAPLHVGQGGVRAHMLQTHVAQNQFMHPTTIYYATNAVMGSSCSKTPEGGAPSDASLSASSSEHFGEEQSDTRQETRVVASNKAQAAKADERVHKTSYVITQVRGLSAASSAQVCVARSRKLLSLTWRVADPPEARKFISEFCL